VRAGALLALAGLGGCVSRSPGPGSPGALAEADWPARITTGLDRLVAGVPSALRVPQDAGTASLVHVSRSESCGLGIVLELANPASEPSADSVPGLEFVFLSFSPLAADAEPGDQLPRAITGDDLRAGVHWHLYEPDDQAPRGLIVHLGGNKYVRRVLLRRGWAVLNAPSTGRHVLRRANPIPFEVEPGERLDQAAVQIAALFDDELADWPYSLEAVLQYLAKHHPGVPQKPTAVMGFSIGAIALPAVVARMPDRFEAVVLVAGGANLLEISCRTSKTDSGIDVTWPERQPRVQDWETLYAAYLARAKLDPYHSAAALSGMPLLIYHAGFDRVVPASTGELLFARAGAAERHVFPVGHKHLLRIVMRLQAEQIVRWTEAALAAAQDAGAPSSRAPDVERRRTPGAVRVAPAEFRRTACLASLER
jgi:predicted esterase